MVNKTKIKSGKTVEQFFTEGVIIVIHRYDNPDTYAFLRFVGSSFDDLKREDMLVYAEDADKMSHTLSQTSMVKTNWYELTDEMKKYITFNIAPIEWHVGLSENESELTERVVVWTH